MAFLNSVCLVQHVHRNLVSWSNKRDDRAVRERANAPEQELRKDRAFSTSNPAWRVYLDNYDLLEKVEATEMVEVQGSVAPGILSLRQEYERWDIPRNIKKSVSRSSRCELQGATVDGEAGVAYPRETKLNKYFLLALSVAQLPAASQKQWQVACGGLVYFSMFRRPLLGSLNQVWRHIQGYEDCGRRVLPQRLLTVNWNSFASWDSFPWLGWTLDLTCTHKLAAVMLPPPGEASAPVLVPPRLEPWSHRATCEGNGLSRALK